MQVRPSPLLSGPALWRYYQPESPNFWTRLKFWVSEKNAQKAKLPSHGQPAKTSDEKFLFDTVVERTPKQGRLTLGTIVRQNSMDDIIAHHNETQKAGTNGKLHIFSVTDAWEMDDKATPLHWKKKGVIHHHVPMTDFTSEIIPESILAAVYQIRQVLEENPNNTVYIHCKAGKARSAMIVATYVAIFGNKHGIQLDEENIVHAAHHVKGKRAQVDLHHEKAQDLGTISRIFDLDSVGKIQKAQKAIELHQTLAKDLAASGDNNPTTNDFVNAFNQYMRYRPWAQGRTPVGTTIASSLEFKNWLVHRTAFKHLQILSTDKSLPDKTRSLITKTLEEIYLAKDDAWISRLQSAMSLLKPTTAKETALSKCLSTIHQYGTNAAKVISVQQSSSQPQDGLWKRVNTQFSIARSIQDKLLAADWSDTSRSSQSVTVAGKQHHNPLPAPAIKMMDKLADGMHRYNNDNTMATALKQVAAIALLESHSNKNNAYERSFYLQFANMIDFEKTFANIVKEIEASNFVARGNGPHAQIKGKDVPTHIFAIHQECNKPAPNQPNDNIHRLIKILRLAKHTPGSSIITSLFRHKVTGKFYSNFEQHLVLKDTAGLTAFAQQLTDKQVAGLKRSLN